jgi:hypothetical protein
MRRYKRRRPDPPRSDPASPLCLPSTNLNEATTSTPIECQTIAEWLRLLPMPLRPGYLLPLSTVAYLPTDRHIVDDAIGEDDECWTCGAPAELQDGHGRPTCWPCEMAC